MSLVFDHALRVRLKAETGESKEESGNTPSSVPVSDAQGSNVSEGSSVNEEDDEETVHSRGVTTASSTTAVTVIPAVTAQTKGKTTEVGKAAAREDEKGAQKKRDNFLGKVQNLITSDIDNITSARNFLFIGKILSLPNYNSNLKLLC